MAFKDYGKLSVKAAQKGREFTALKPDDRPTRKKFSPVNPWWARKRHPGWAAYHANKDKNSTES